MNLDWNITLLITVLILPLKGKVPVNNSCRAVIERSPVRKEFFFF